MTDDEQLAFGRVLKRTVDLVQENRRMKLADALDIAVRESGRDVPETVQNAILMATFRIITNGFPTKVNA